MDEAKLSVTSHPFRQSSNRGEWNHGNEKIIITMNQNNKKKQKNKKSKIKNQTNYRTLKIK